MPHTPSIIQTFPKGNGNSSENEHSGHIIQDKDNNLLTEREKLKFDSDLEVSDDQQNDRTIISPHVLTQQELTEIIGEIGSTNPPTNGINGASAYEIALAHGFTGTEEQWLDSLKGADGQQGPQGEAGPQGETGATGAQGPQGETGPAGADGATGAQGPAGQGVPTGGTTGQVLKKVSDTDYDAEWADEESGGASNFDDLTNRPEAANDVSDILSDIEIPVSLPSSYVPNTGYTPIGTIISVMGNSAPRYYLACDGAEYNISDYPELANYFAQQFSEDGCNIFGGDGITTFAVPDLRGEFLRGTGTNSHEGNGNGANVGVHQDATRSTNFSIYNNNLIYPRSGGDYKDSTISVADRAYVVGTTQSGISDHLYTSRPTNTSVLYCIAYKDIYVDARYDYSTIEKVVGTWIDGSSIYQKTIDCGALPNTTIKEVAHNIINIGTLINIYGFTLKEQEGTTIPVNTKTYLYCTDENVILRTTSDMTSWTECFVTLIYTKEEQQEEE